MSMPTALFDGGPLFYAIYTGNAAMTKNLLNNGANPNSLSSIGDTPLLRAISLGHADCVRVLLGRGANYDLQTPAGMTALIMSAQMGNEECLRILLDHKANPNLCSDLTITPLISAITHNHPSCVEILLMHGADPNLRDGCNMTPLMIACSLRKYSIPIVRMLLKYGTDLNAQGSFGRTALMEAVLCGSDASLLLLLQAGADDTIKDCYNNTAMSLASNECFKILQDWTDIPHA